MRKKKKNDRALVRRYHKPLAYTEVSDCSRRTNL